MTKQNTDAKLMHPCQASQDSCLPILLTPFVIIRCFFSVSFVALWYQKRFLQYPKIVLSNSMCLILFQMSKFSKLLLGVNHKIIFYRKMTDFLVFLRPWSTFFSLIGDKCTRLTIQRTMKQNSTCNGDHIINSIREGKSTSKGGGGRGGSNGKRRT